MASLADLKKEQRIKAIVFGRFKSGKTAGAGTFPRSRWIDFDQGTATLLNRELEAKYGYSKNIVDIEVCVDDRDKHGVITKPRALDQASDYFDKCMNPKLVDTFDTWVIDSGTTLFEAARSKGVFLLGQGIGGMRSETQKTSETHGLRIPKQQDYMAERSMAEQFVDMVMSADKNVLLLCHEKEVYNDDGSSVTEIVPLLTGQSVERIPLKFDEVWNLRTKKSGTDVKRYLQTQPDGLRKCGSRRGLPNETPFEYAAINAALTNPKEGK